MASEQEILDRIKIHEEAISELETYDSPQHKVDSIPTTHPDCPDPAKTRRELRKDRKKEASQ